MANKLNTNPIFIDTVMISGYKGQVASSLGTLFTLKVEKIQWEGAVTNGDVVTIVDPVTDNVLAQMTAVAAGTYFLDWVANPKIWQDFRVSALSSGHLWIFTR